MKGAWAGTPLPRPCFPTPLDSFAAFGSSSIVTKNFQMYKLGLEKAQEPEIKLPTSIGSENTREFQENIYFCFIDYTKAFDCVDHNNL